MAFPRQVAPLKIQRLQFASIVRKELIVSDTKPVPAMLIDPHAPGPPLARFVHEEQVEAGECAFDLTT